MKIFIFLLFSLMIFSSCNKVDAPKVTKTEAAKEDCDSPKEIPEFDEEEEEVVDLANLGKTEGCKLGEEH